MKRFKISQEWITAGLCVVALAGGAARVPNFLDIHGLLEDSSLYVETGILALGLMLVVISGQIDLSVASNMALVACLVAKFLAAGMPVIVVIPVAIAIGACLGWFNGWLVSRFSVPSFVVTVATLALYRGIAQAMLGAQSVKLPASYVGIDYKTIPGTPIPLPLVIFVVIAGITALLLHRSIYGRWLAMVGSNPRASLFAGVPVRTVTSAAFAISGAYAGVGGLLIDSRLGVARYDHAKGLELDVVTVVVLGGVSIFGGEGTVPGVILAMLLTALVRIQLGQSNVTAEYQLAVIGAMLVVTVILSRLNRKTR